MSDLKLTYENPHKIETARESGNSLLGHVWASIAATIVLGVICCGLYPLIVFGIGQIIFPIQANGSLVKNDGSFATDDTKAVGSALMGQSFSARQYFHPRPSAANNSAGSSYSSTAGYDATSSGGTNYGTLNDILINGQTGVPTPPATAPSTSPIVGNTSAPASQPAKIVTYDGVRLRVIHYCLENAIAFRLYYVNYDAQGRIISRTQVPLAEFLDKDGNLNDAGLIEAFPHAGDPADKLPLIAADFTAPIPADAVTASASGLDPHISPRNAALQKGRVAGVRHMTEDAVQKLIDQYTDRPAFGLLGDPGVNVLRLNLALDSVAPDRDCCTHQPIARMP